MTSADREIIIGNNDDDVVVSPSVNNTVPYELLAPGGASNDAPPPSYHQIPTGGASNDAPLPSYQQLPPGGASNDAPPTSYQQLPPGGASKDAPPPSYQQLAPEGANSDPALTPQPVATEPSDPDSYFHFAICMVICCFWPLGVVAVTKSVKALQDIKSGDLELAKKSSAEALRWCIGALVAGLVMYGCITGGVIFLFLYRYQLQFGH